MKVSEMFVVEGDPVRGGLHIKPLRDVLDLNRRAFERKEERPLLVLSLQPSLTQAQEVERELKRNRGETPSSAEGTLPDVLLEQTKSGVVRWKLFQGKYYQWGSRMGRWPSDFLNQWGEIRCDVEVVR